MKKWICKSCGLYKRVNPHEIKSGNKVFFIKINGHKNNVNMEIDRGVVLSRKDSSLIILSNNILFTVEDSDVYPVNAPVPFIYNMFGTCSC